MVKTLLDSLADEEVPPPPAELDKRVHERVNRALLIAHLLDFVLCGVPYVLGHLVWGIIHLCETSISGRFETRAKAPPPEAP